ncbi:MAG: hypothetical protein KY460_01325 [Actinobacteria bacterium]|nr:hypothetical protein [Actinomycetota bacterium]
MESIRVVREGQPTRQTPQMSGAIPHTAIAAHHGDSERAVYVRGDTVTFFAGDVVDHRCSTGRSNTDPTLDTH